MIRSRDTQGNLRELPANERFIEICDTEGNVAFVVFEDDNGKVVILEHDTPEGQRYAKLFGIEYAKQVTLPKFLTETNV